MQKHNSTVMGQIKMRAHHGHERCNAGTGVHEQVFFGGEVCAGEVARGREDTHAFTYFQVVVQPVRDRPVDLSLDCNAYRVRASGRRGDGVAAVDLHTVYLQFKGQELAGRKVKKIARRCSKGKCLDVVRFVRDGAAYQRLFVVAAPPRRRSEEHTSELQSLMRSSYA